MNTELYNLTNPQKSIWLTEQFYKGSSINNLCGTIMIHEPLNFDLLKKAINRFLKDNDSLRLRVYIDEQGNVKQYISDFSEMNFIIHDVESDYELKPLENKIVETPFKIINSPLFDIQLYRLPNSFGGIIVKAHHLVCDACTANLIASKIVNIYSSLLKEEEITEVPTSYINYINSENDYLVSNKFEKDKEYWNTTFESVPEIGTIPSLKASNNSCEAARKTFIFSNKEVENINQFCKDNKISVFNFFMAIYAIYIGRVSNLDNIVLGTPILNRTTFVEKNTPGMFISTVPFRFSMKDAISFIDFTKKIAMDTLSMFRHQKYPYQDILEHIRKTNSSQPNLYDILISYQNTKIDKDSSNIPYEVRWTFNSNVADSLQIHLFDMNDEGKLNIAYDYRLSKYDENDICDLHNRISYMIKQVLDCGTVYINDIDIVTPDEKDLILNKFNDTYMKYDHSKTIVDYFEAQVEKTPDRVAGVFLYKYIYYREIN